MFLGLIRGELIMLVIAIMAILIYPLSVTITNKSYKKWPIKRTIFWLLGVTSATSALVGPIATYAHHNFIIHMVGHLLLGMLAPLLIALSAPVSLLLRTLSTANARRVTELCKCKFVRFLSHPLTASILNIGGLWLLYTTPLYMAMHHHPVLHLLIHLHVVFAGYLFIVSIIYIDPIHYRLSYLYRSIVMVLALAAHGILSKYIYAFPPIGIEQAQAERGGILMYYGGDAIDLILIVIFCSQWYKDSRPKNSTIYA